MFKEIKEVYNFRYLLYIFTARDILARYKQTFIGVVWAVIQPLFLMLVFTIIFSRFLGVSSGGVPYPVFSYVALLPWTFLTRVINTSSASLISYKSLINKIYFPREVVPLSVVVSSLLDFFIGSLVFVLMLIYYKIPIEPTALYVLLLIPIQVIFAAGMSLLLSTVTVFIRDLKFAIPLFIQIWMYATPIIYSITNIKSNLRVIFYFNPVVGIIESYRQVILHGNQPLWNYLAISIVFSVILFLTSFRFFKKMEPIVVDII
jgi:lipopolysaccharide transport system permease protein